MLIGMLCIGFPQLFRLLAFSVGYFLLAFPNFFAYLLIPLGIPCKASPTFPPTCSFHWVLLACFPQLFRPLAFSIGYPLQNSPNFFAYLLFPLGIPCKTHPTFLPTCVFHWVFLAKLTQLFLPLAFSIGYSSSSFPSTYASLPLLNTTFFIKLLASRFALPQPTQAIRNPALRAPCSYPLSLRIKSFCASKLAKALMQDS